MTKIFERTALIAVFIIGASTFAADALAAKTQAPIGLRNVRAAAGRIKHATLEVVNDVGQRKIAVATGDPRVFEPSEKQVEQDTKLWSQALKQLGPLEAPRKAWLDADVADVKRWVDLLNEDLKAFTADATVTTAAATLNKHFADLQAAAAGPAYDNLKIAAAALAVRDDAKQLQKLSTR